MAEHEPSIGASDDWYVAGVPTIEGSKSKAELRQLPEYQTWKSMRARCLNPKRPDYQNYGGRGISVCNRWSSFEAFLADVGRRPSADHSIERRNNGLGYNPENCLWATKKQQCNNRRSNIILTHEGKSQTVVEWAVELGISYEMIRQRVHRGYSDADALTKPQYPLRRIHNG